MMMMPFCRRLLSIGYVFIGDAACTVMHTHIHAHTHNTHTHTTHTYSIYTKKTGGADFDIGIIAALIGHELALLEAYHVGADVVEESSVVAFHGYIYVCIYITHAHTHKHTHTHTHTHTRTHIHTCVRS